MAVLQQIIDGRPCDVIALSGRYVLIGRDQRCDVVIECKVASRRHAQIEIHADHFYLKDLKSRNGTVVNGRRITQMHVLHHGDEIVISKSIFRFLKSTSGVIQHSPNPAHTGGHYVVTTDVPWNDDSIQHENVIEGQFISRAEMNMTPIPTDKIVGELRFPEDMSAIAISGDQNAKLRLLLQGLSALRGAVEEPAVFARAAELLLSEFRQFETVILVRATEQPEGVEVVAALTRLNSRRIEFAGSLISTAMTQKKAVLVQDHWRPSRSHEVSFSTLTMHTLLSCPVMWPGGDAVGAIQLEASHSNVIDTQVLMERLIAFSVLLSSALELSGRMSAQKSKAALDRTTDLGVTSDQFGNDRVPRVPGYKIFVQRSSEATVRTSHVTSVCLDRTRVAIALVEVEVRGAESGLLAACIRQLLIQSLRETGSAVEALRVTEQKLGADLVNAGSAISAAIAVLDCNRGTVVISIVGSCPILVSSQGEVRPLEQSTSNIGRLGTPRSEYLESEIALGDGDSLVVLSEGTYSSLRAVQNAENKESDVLRVLCESLQVAAQVPESIDLRLSDELTKRSEAGTLPVNPVFLIMHRCEVPPGEFVPGPALTES